MLINAYHVESRPVPVATDEMSLPTPVPIGTLQFTGGSNEGRTERERKEMATDLLMYHSPLVDHITYGHSTWHTEKISVDEDSLGTPSFEDAVQGYRIWLPKMP